jgi:hypothetical protein
MELKQLVKQFSYRIEPKPGGGFIARSTDPAVEPLEAPTREKLQRKIEEKVSAALAESFPGLKIPLQHNGTQIEFHIERKAEGGFSVHSTELGGPAMQPATQERIDHYAEQLLGFVDEHFPDLKEAMAAKVLAQQAKAIAAQEGAVSGNTASPFSSMHDLLPTNPMQNGSAGLTKTIVGNVKPSDTNFANVGSAIENNPITPQGGGSWAVFRFLLAALIVALLAYFFLNHR